MSTPSPDANGSVPSDGFADTTLIAQLAGEMYAEIQRVSHGAGSPAPAGPARDNGLAGAYPAETPSYAPPVHPASHTGSRQTRSGGHSPGAADSYPYGEPRCPSHTSNAVKPQPITETKAAETPPAPSNGEDWITSPPFYFLHEPEGRGRTVLAGATPAAVPVHPAFDIQGVRLDFPALHQRVNGKPLIWLDNAATTHKPRTVIDATSQFYGHDNSNIHRAAHALAQRATDLYEGGREKVRRFLGAADAREIVFVRGTTEAINLVAQTFGKKFIGPGDEILLTTMEHHANIVPWQLLAEQTGVVIRVAPINDRGELILDQFAALLNSRTKLAAVAHVSNALGTVNPVEQIIALSHAHGVPVLVDGAQSTPHMPVSVQAMDADFFVFSGHKIFGPTGIGVLYGKTQWLEQLPPWQGGGNMIRDVTFTKTSYQNAPQKFEAGTPDIAGVVGLGAAVDYLMRIGLPAIAAYEHELLDYATAALATVPGLRPIGTAAARASVLSFVMEGIPNEQVGKHLDKHGIAVRAGHHCAQPTVRRFGLEGTVRPSLALYNTREEIDALVLALHQLPVK
jgi:SufS family cysteine desulfurase